MKINLLSLKKIIKIIIMGQLAIFGHGSRYEEINNIFKTFGIKLTDSFKCDNPEYIYYIDGNNISIADSNKLKNKRLLKWLGYELYNIDSFNKKFGEIFQTGKHIVSTGKSKYRIVSHLWSQNVGLLYVCEKVDCVPSDRAYRTDMYVYIAHTEIDTLATKLYNEVKESF
jgi:hypothetical protein